MEKITKKDIAAAIKDKFSLSKEVSNDIVNFMIETIVSELKGKNKVYLDGLGTFTNVQKEERMSVNPRDPQGPKIKVPAKGSPKFKASKGLKEALK